MARIVYNKLVRDGIPAIIAADGQIPNTRILSDSEYRQALFEKLIEEATELLESDGSMAERADIAEVLKSIDELLGLTPVAVESARKEKATKRGGFESRIYLKEVIAND